jgi:2-C-methyl-D-erythritol 2,4-cyclodiphosphate synthase
MRIGVGYDVHAFTSGRRLVLGGVEVPFEKGLAGYSDADVVIHAIIDALLGATALGDIGTLFPPNDPKYKDISSGILLRSTGELLEAHGWQVGNIDATIIAQQPHLAPFLGQMRNNISRILGISKEQVAAKATTTDGLGFTGRGEGIAVQAIALVTGRGGENI